MRTEARFSRQLVSHTEAPFRIGHYYLNVTSVEAHKKFWADMLGRRAMNFGGIDVIEFPDAFIFLHVQKPAGPTRGTAFDHIGFAVPNVAAMATKLAGAGYQDTTGREPKPGEPPPAASGTSAVYGRFLHCIRLACSTPESRSSCSPPAPRRAEGVCPAKAVFREYNVLSWTGQRTGGRS